MRSSNPVFSRRGSFGRGNGYAGFGTPQAGQQPQAGNPYAQGNPYNLTPNQPVNIGPPAPPVTGRMTVDDVVMRTAITLGVLVVGAALGWFLVPVGSWGVGFLAAIVAFGIALAIIFRRMVSPPLIIAYSALEGFFIGVISHAYNYLWDGVVAQAVIGTMAVFAGTLAAYKIGAIRVTARYARVGIAIAIGFVILTFVNFLAAVIGGGDGLGLRSGGLGIVVGIIGVLLGAFFLTLDFKEIEEGVRYGAPAEQSWVAAFGLTLSLVWIYLELLRLLSILRD